MLIGYVRISKSDGSQTLATRRDTLLAAGVADERIHQDLASGRHDARPGLLACLKASSPATPWCSGSSIASAVIFGI